MDIGTLITKLPAIIGDVENILSANGKTFSNVEQLESDLAAIADALAPNEKALIDQVVVVLKQIDTLVEIAEKPATTTA